ncbi:MAG TPA: DUF2057 domain-containing protein [Thiotrichaceae bacterium]|jgi:uncharacterized protein YccT (UPF0319 family)|nr:DUF2057 domain-containing protein [Thiotrichaceae bacterium]HIM07613.1 DUF2057 domain-containing protein [Gammaproteobacteria bacterium]
MKYKLVVFLILSVSFMTSAVASELRIPNTFEFLAIDGKDIGGWLSKSQSVELTPGQHKIALKYDAVIEGDNPRIEEFVSSEPILVTLVVKSGHNYMLVPHSSVKSAPREFAENPRVKIVDSDGSNVNADVALRVKKEQSKWAKMTQSYDTPIASQVSDMAKLTGVVAAPASSITSAPTIVANGSPASSMLVYWWNQADQATRDAFIKQISK